MPKQAFIEETGLFFVVVVVEEADFWTECLRVDKIQISKILNYDFDNSDSHKVYLEWWAIKVEHLGTLSGLAIFHQDSEEFKSPAVWPFIQLPVGSAGHESTSHPHVPHFSLPPGNSSPSK